MNVFPGRYSTFISLPAIFSSALSRCALVSGKTVTWLLVVNNNNNIGRPLGPRFQLLLSERGPMKCHGDA